MKSEHDMRARSAPQGGFVPLAAAVAPLSNPAGAFYKTGNHTARSLAPCARAVGEQGVGPSVSAQPEEGQLWEQVRSRLRARIGEDNFVSWFGEANYEGMGDQVAVISVSTRFLRSWVKSNYTDILIELFRAEGAEIKRLDVLERGSVVTARLKTANVAEKAAPKQVSETVTRSISMPRSAVDSAQNEALDCTPDKRMTFDSFKVSQSNLIAHSAACRIAGTLDQVQFNPLYIYGSVGLGKTHLLNALVHAAREKNRRVLYLTAESFRFGFLKALTNRTAANAFKETMRGFDLLLIDDLQFLQGKHTEAEFGHTLNALLDGSRQVVVACDRPPCELETVDERLRSRLGGGLTVQIAAPEEDLRRKILTAKAELERQRYPDLVIPESVIGVIARAVDSNGRDLEGAFNRLVHYHQLRRAPISIEMAEEILRGFVKARDPKRVKIEDIIRITSKYYNIHRNDLLSSRRTRNVVMPRQIAMFLAKTMTPRSLPEIGSRFGNRDHTTVLHAVRKIESLLQEDQRLSTDVDMLKQIILEG